MNKRRVTDVSLPLRRPGTPFPRCVRSPCTRAHPVPDTNLFAARPSDVAKHPVKGFLIKRGVSQPSRAALLCSFAIYWGDIQEAAAVSLDRGVAPGGKCVWYPPTLTPGGGVSSGIKRESVIIRETVNGIVPLYKE
ncbi:hypothetical protein GOBAR_AA20538 [Gossypium barbadense]|uniref:Uncharacterized protein n=1 Tax=Gossypium barbadense TaxID=3634 RepID=A0A2P5X9W7_GOSBA|nr:hypothetical protein GOBAR_AA20538 [Gossypium barbadense]